FLFFSSLLHLLFNLSKHTDTTVLYTLSLHDALPISSPPRSRSSWPRAASGYCPHPWRRAPPSPPAPDCRSHRAPSIRCRGRRWRSEEHTSELQSRGHLVCRLLLEKKKKIE